MRTNQRNIVRGAVAGALAAGVWAAQQPLDKRAFGFAFDDVELLGKALTRGRGWRAAGTVIHLTNGALFGALYVALVRERIPLRPSLRGPAIGLIEHLATWPATALTDALHPARDELPRLHGSRRAFAQATWRHLLFGAVLGETERRINADPPRRDVAGE